MCGCPGRFFGVQAFVDSAVDHQSITPAGTFDKLPHASGPRRRAGLGVEAAFHHGQISQVHGQPTFPKNSFNHGQIASRASQRPGGKPFAFRREINDIGPDLLVHLNGKINF